MKKNYKKIFFAIVLVFLFFPISVIRAEKISISVDRTIFSFSANPGSANEIKFKVSNISSEPQNIEIVPEDFVVGDDNSISNTIDKNEQFGMKDWVLSSEKNYALDPKETREIALSINIPEKATVGAHYAIANIRALPQVDGQNFQSAIVGGEIGVYILLNVNGEVSGSGNLKQFQAPIIAGDNVPLKADFENTGNILYIPHGEIQIKNLFTHKNSNIETEKHFVFPGTKYSFEANWDAPSALGAYSAQANFVDANGVNHTQKRLILGKFFFVFPLLILAILVIIFVRKRKKDEPK